MMRWTRRRVVAALGLSPFSVGCVDDGLGWPPTGNGGAILAPLVDAHCHLFNITDLPAARFVQRVIARNYAHALPEKDWEQRLYRALRTIERILRTGVLRAGAEADRRGEPLVDGTPALTADDERELAKARREAEEAIGREGFSADRSDCGGGGGPVTSLGTAIRWLRSLRSSRAAMARELASANARSGFASRLLCPALVDYSNWLDQELASPLPDQIRAAGSLSRNPDLPPIHGYVAYDPLRRALVREGRAVADGTWDPLDLVRTALVDEGFLGVKLYPPMGFRPSGNAGSGDRYQPHVERAFGDPGLVAAALDRSLDELWRVCVELDAPVLAHGADSNMAGSGFGRRADPAFWLPALRRNPGLRVMLAHFGRFESISGGPASGRSCPGEVPFEATWEAEIGRHVRDHPDTGLFADISYFSDIFEPEARARAAAGLRAYLAFDGQARHLVYGSDWVMLGIERDYLREGGYPRRVVRFLRECGLDDAAISGVMHGNALRFLGLSADGGARRRLLDFYTRVGLPLERLPG